MKEPDSSIFTNNDYSDYAEILQKTSAIKHGNKPTSRKPKSSKGYKYKTLIKPIWEDLYGYSSHRVGKGLKTTIIPKDPIALVERLDLLLASKKAGNTGVRNELISVCDELLRQEVITKDLYKKLMVTI